MNHIRSPLFVFVLCILMATNFVLGVAVPSKAEGSSRNGDWNQKNAIEWLSTCGTAKEDWIKRVIETSDESIVTGGYIGRQDDSQQPSDWDGGRHDHWTPPRARERV